MRYSIIRKLDISNGPYIGVSIFLQGCLFHCENCFNKVAWSLDGGKEFTEDVRKEFLELVKGVKRISFLGGEPLLQADELYGLIKEIKDMYPEKQIWLWTGYYLSENLTESQRNVIDLCDYIVDGRYIDSLKDDKLYLRGSSNQTIWKHDKVAKKFIEDTELMNR